MILNDQEITELVNEMGLIAPFCDKLVRRIGATPCLSYGLGSYGYDIRLSEKEFFLFDRNQENRNGCIDPKNFNPDLLSPVELLGDKHGDYYLLPRYSYGLGVAVERIKMPEDMTGLAIGKSTYARCGVIANFTPIEAGWEGHLTLEFANPTPFPCRLYANEGVAQVLFFRGTKADISYFTRRGKYHGQPEKVVFAKCLGTLTE